MEALAEQRHLPDLGQPLQEIHGLVRLLALELKHGLGHVFGLQRPRRAQGDEFAAVHDAEAVAVFGLLHVVCGHENRDALSGQRVDQVPELAPAVGVDAGRGLVEEEDGRLVQDGAAKGEALLPAAREFGGARMPVVLQPRHGEHPVLARGLLIAGQAIDAAVEIDVLLDGEFVVEREPLAHVADARLDLLGVAHDVEARHAALAGSRCEQAAEHADGGGLARAVGSEKTEDLAAPHAEAHAGDGLECAETLHEVADLDNRLGGGGGGSGHGAAGGVPMAETNTSSSEGSMGRSECSSRSAAVRAVRMRESREAVGSE